MFYRVLILVCLLFSCKKKEGFENIQVFGHGGNGVQISNSIYHDNTQESVDLALAQNGCDGVEVDIQFSKDGTAWLYHDAYLENETDGNGCLNSLSDAEIEKLRYTSVHQEKLIKLQDLKLYGNSIFLDLKHYNFCSNEFAEIADVITGINVFKDLNSASEINVITNYDQWLSPLLDENLNVFFEPETYSQIESNISTFDLKGFVFKNDMLAKDEITALKNQNKKVVLFEIRSPKGIRSAMKKNPDVVLTDDIKATLIEKY